MLKECAMKHTPYLSIALLALVAFLGLQACEDFYTNVAESQEEVEVEDDGRMFMGAYVGEDCSQDADCRDGLVCESGQCVGSGTKGANAKCLLTIECDGSANPPTAPHGLHCGWAGFCVKSCVGCPWCGDGICNGEETNGSCSADCGSGQSGADCQDLSGTTADISIGVSSGPSCSADAGQEGSDCSTSSECARDFFCDMQGLSGFCTRPDVPAGKGDLGDTCASTKECYLGLKCSEVSGTCVPGSILLYPDLFGGEDCSGSHQVEAEMPFGMRMAIPGEQYALPLASSCSQDSECTTGVCCAAGSEREGTCADANACDQTRDTSSRLDFFSFPFPNDGLHSFHEDLDCGESTTDAAEALVCASDLECSGASVCCEEGSERGGTCAEEALCDQALIIPKEDSFAECPDGEYRARAGTVNYQGFPVPGNGLIGFDPVGASILALDGEVQGWSLFQAATLRFTRRVFEEDLAENIFIVNLETGKTHPSVVTSHATRNKFACENRIFIQPLLSHPLEPGVPYAVVATTGLRTSIDKLDEQGNVMRDELGLPLQMAGTENAQALESLPMLLGDEEPSGEEALAIWESFQALRDAAGRDDVPSLSAIAGATVFTPGDPTAVVDEIREMVDKAPVPKITWAVKCEGPDTPTRCATPGFVASAEGTDPRGCQEQGQFYTEYHAQVEIPVIQRGTRPYIKADANDPISGDLNYVNGTLTPTKKEKVCVSFSVPNFCDLQGCQPGVPAMDQDWPVLLYGHGTGGTHRQGIALLGSELSSRTKITTDADGDLTTTPEMKSQFMVVAWDQPMHHLRRFPEEAVENWNADTYTLAPAYESEYAKEPGPLFYNFQNPRAARANYLQAVADTFSLVKLLAQGSVTIDGTTHDIDTSRLAYHGHSQGGGNGPMVAPFEPALDLMLLSGTGGGTVDGILGKKLPYDSSIGCRIMLQEIDVSRSHPGIQVLQHYFDAIDPGIYAPLLKDPPSERGMNFMEVVGVLDSFTPPVSMAAYARGAGLDLLKPSGDLPIWFDFLEEGQSSYIQSDPERYVSGEVGANRTIGGEEVTHVSIQHPPCLNDAVCTTSVPALPSFDGHFVVYQNTDSLKEALSFIYSWADDGEAVVTPYGSNAN